LNEIMLPFSDHPFAVNLNLRRPCQKVPLELDVAMLLFDEDGRTVRLASGVDFADLIQLLPIDKPGDVRF
jgi:hypothetical protein